MLFTKRLIMTAAVLCLSINAYAAINNHPSTFGQWQSTDGRSISVGADGLKSYADSEDQCKEMGSFKHSSERYQGREILAQMKDDLAYSQELVDELKSDSEYAESVAALQNSIKAIKAIQSSIKANQSYHGVALECGDAGSEVIFLSDHLALEREFIGGETFYSVYKK